MAAIGVERTGIARAAVIGAGAMGGGIAAQFANAGIPVDLLDQKGGDSGAGPAEEGLARQVKIGGFMVPEAAALVRPGNVEDDLPRLAQADWVIEAVVEEIGVKRALFARLAPHLKPGAILSSNTSTLPRSALIADLPPDLARRFAITHFFNPPRVMRLLEVVAEPALAPRLAEAATVILGKTVIACRDTPGFIANRIGCFWMAVAALEARRLGLTVEEADAVQAALGTPRTGVFGLFDLVGIDLVPTVWGSLMAGLPPGDVLHRFALPEDPLFRSLRAQGRLGRKSGAGFYRKAADGSPEALDLITLDYRPRQTPPALPRDPAALLAEASPAGGYARATLSAVLDYAATHAPEIAEDIGAIDTAMELGYSWRDGPFALAARAGLPPLAGGVAGPLLRRGLTEGFYDQGRPLAMAGGRAARRGAPPLDERPVITANTAARLHDLGDGVACFRAQSKMNTFAPEVFDLLEETLDRAGRDYTALVLGNDDPRAFSAGADLGFFLRMAEAPDGPARIDAYGARGQALFLRMRRAPVPVVAALQGFTLGGGCEFQLHADAAVAHAEVTIGLPETGVGLVPGWGGCTRLLARAAGLGPLAAAQAAFAALFSGRVANSAAEGQAVGYLRAEDGIVMARERLIGAAEAVARRLRPGYVPPAPERIALSGAAGREALLAAPRADHAAGRITDTDLHLAEVLAGILTCQGRDSATEEEILQEERAALTALTERESSRARIDHMLRTGQRLRN